LIVSFVHSNLKLELSREHLDAKIASFYQSVDVGSLTSSLAQIRVLRRRVESSDRKISVIFKRLKHEIDPLLDTLRAGMKSIRTEHTRTVEFKSKLE